MASDAGFSASRDAGEAATQRPEPSSKPEVGGSMPGGGPCDSPPVTQRIRFYSREMLPISRDSGLWLDAARARVVDVSDPAAPRVRGKVDLGDAALAPDADAGTTDPVEVTMTPLAEGRFVAAVRHSPYNMMPDDLVVLGFDDPDAPTVLQRIDIPGDIALVTVMPDENATRVFAVSDEIELRCLGPSKQSYLYSFSFEQDALVQTEKMALGDNLALAERRGDYLVLIDGTYVDLVRGEAREPTLRTVSLKQKVSVISEHAQAPFVGYSPPALAISIQADTMTLVFVDAKVSPGLRLRRYALSEANTPKLTSDCVSTAPTNVRFESPANVAVLGDRVIAEGYWAAIGNGPSTNELIELNIACEMLRQEQSVNLIDVPSAGVALEASLSDSNTLRVQLRDGTHDEPVATATVPIPSDRKVALRDNVALTNAVMFEQNGTLERGLLGVAIDERVLQLFSFSTSTVTARGTLLGATRLNIPTRSGVAATSYDATWGDTLGTFALDSNASAARKAIGELRLSPLN